MMRIALVTDEVSADLETALELAARWEIDAIELRGVGEGRYPRVSPFLRESTPRLLAESEAKVIGLSPGLFKISVPQPFRPLHFMQLLEVGRHRHEVGARAQLEDHLENLLPECIEAAQELGCELITCFGFEPGDALEADILGVDVEEVPDAVVEVLREAARVAAKAGITLSLENETICWGAMGEQAAAIARAVGEPNFGITWDPANALLAGDTPFPTGYTEVAQFVRHVHFKDAVVDPVSRRRHFVLDGDVDWAGQIEALHVDGYEGYVSVETHLRPKLSSTEQRVAELRALLSSGSLR